MSPLRARCVLALLAPATLIPAMSFPAAASASAQETRAAEAPTASVDPWPGIGAGSTMVADATGQAGTTYRYRLVSPKPEAIADPGARVPLVVFLHGSGERGDDNAAQLKHFAGWCGDDALQSRHPCYVLAMQCPAGETWAALDLKAYREKGELPRRAAEPTRAMRALMQAIDEIVATRAVDPTRVYLTGLSMGGFGALDLAARRPELFAAVVPVCGGGDPTTADILATIPCYIVHGSDDPVVPVALSRAMRDAIAGAAAARAAAEREQARGTPDAPRPMPKRAPNPMYREYDKVGHDSWTPAYRFGDDGVLDWMFAQRKASPRKPSTDGAASPATGAPTGK